MAFFATLGQKISDAGQSVAQQTRNLTEVTRLNSQISSHEKQIEELYTVIGQAYYEANKDDPAVLALESVQQVTALREEIAKAQERIKEIRGVGKCPQCGADVPQGAQYCGACGCKLETPAPAEEPARPVCANCGAELEPGSLFCTKCGHKVEKEPAPEEPAPEEPAPEEPASEEPAPEEPAPEEKRDENTDAAE